MMWLHWTINSICFLGLLNVFSFILLSSNLYLLKISFPLKKPTTSSVDFESFCLTSASYEIESIQLFNRSKRFLMMNWLPSLAHGIKPTSDTWMLSVDQALLYETLQTTNYREFDRPLMPFVSSQPHNMATLLFRDLSLPVLDRALHRLA